MQTEHFITGKDASPESSISTMRSRLEGIGGYVEERFFAIAAPLAGDEKVHGQSARR